ncbi:class II aldolase/adducin family protein [Mycobacteroides saopaulense]|uniref:Class II aldolase/adducin family protein n=1 Tax=Mycobacteroides saopaulense TaxID=1578165 RepID=A0ABX3BV35_9MYCO|nr:class II aldolase/adducin family protein [Mycobacteroides saopaulense]OHT87944.1 class II aldolase/adducin family protein [Mycobacteroides saopaulense]OHU06287.1 class II aldolase/adducin family protein [Mycobacteroides saopaulense]
MTSGDVVVGDELSAYMVGSADAELLSPAPTATVGEERERRLRELAAAFRIFGAFGFSEGVAGHITVRDPEFPDTFWVNPFGMNFRHITVSDLIQVDHDGNVITGTRPVNRAAFCIHSEVHKARPDVIAAAHAHSIHGKAFSSLGQPLLPITQDACAFYEDHAVYTDYRGVVSDLEEGRAIGSALGPAKAVILQNHGLLTVGHSVAEAAWWFITMERSCQAQLLAMAAGEPRTIDHETAVSVYNQIGTPVAGWFQFQPLWDDVIRTAPEALR